MRDPNPGAATAAALRPLGAQLAQIAALGPFFAVETHDPAVPAAPPWRPMAELVEDPAVPAGRAAQVRGYLAAGGGPPLEAVELRVAASVTQLGLAARLLSPALAAAVLHRALLPISLTEARWQPVPGGMFPLSVPHRPLPAAGAPDEELVGLLESELPAGPIAALAEALAPLSVSPHILWGNVASALNGAATALAAAAPEHGPRARELAGRLLAGPTLLGAATGTEPGARFLRRSCCLIYRAAPGGAGVLCGDCVLTERRGHG
ncbi:(2Fe-2S)-binding protein [Kitasatospora nipponensis]|uniref:(2Fe-2S)-binding protein n=1 Tax=Kitasatospora nipponensis TaxID=258049 RepID=A0ABP4G8N6_9ACTN